MGKRLSMAGHIWKAELAKPLRERLADADQSEQKFQYSRWRHGGWYVDNVRYPSGACGCVSRNYPDKKWRIVCDKRAGDHTYSSRDAAASAEREIVAQLEARP